MRIAHDFSELWKIANLLGAERQSFSLSRVSTISAIEAELIHGREVKLDELETISGLLAFQGRQILLYIPDQGQRIEEVLNGNRDAGKKFHVAYCATLDSMKNSGRFERYIATTDISGTFALSGTDMALREMTGHGKLYVCQNCLNMLNYKQAKVNRSAKVIRQHFDLSEFFETFSSCFRFLPIRTKVDPGSSVYAANWREISDSLREALRWTCEGCGIHLANAKQLLHVHHVDGVKSNNASSNLKVLCKACHRMEPLHDHMYVPRDEMKTINRMRRDAGVFDGSWESVMRFADPAIQGALGMARNQGWEAPEIEHQVPGTDRQVEAAWPSRRMGITLEHPTPSAHGWRIVDLFGFANICT
ncbi:HNH endonuclease signature motif containing protein [Inhella gelatinilytica]|uniref:HNH endonuclease n=1 Tax=Inhella gelatinilytica TaxID=2795030 RepID=A0A931NFW2_9BURK|nr:HNH endonuclease signature motif containing protein [Inhella gelatinilytica]MBH9553956.1 HNH endonuclease [Inhella gelatinilytica]